MFKSATTRLYPSTEQQRQLWKMIDAYRFAFNWLLHLRKFLYEDGKVSLGIYSWSSDHPRWGDRVRGLSSCETGRALKAR